jgi:predicted transcriptional regulator of viral defense system
VAFIGPLAGVGKVYIPSLHRLTEIMPRPSRLHASKDEIFSFFIEAPQKIFTEPEIASVLSQHRQIWKLAENVKRSDFISFLGKHGHLKRHQFHSAQYDQKINRYSWGTASLYELALSLKRRSYLCHATALMLHGLVESNQKTIYLNAEQSTKLGAYASLTQAALDRAFSSKQRQSNLIYTNNSSSVVMIAGKNTNRLGVEEVVGPASETVQATNLERTLIDIVVRPAYAGGISQVLKAYHSAKGRVSIDRMLSILKQLDHVYPYHQAVGFLMEMAGYPQHGIDQLRAIGLNHDFYLAHGLKEPKYSKDWRLFYPQNFHQAHSPSSRIDRI